MRGRVMDTTGREDLGEERRIDPRSNSNGGAVQTAPMSGEDTTRPRTGKRRWEERILTTCVSTEGLRAGRQTGVSTLGAAATAGCGTSNTWRLGGLDVGGTTGGDGKGRLGTTMGGTERGGTGMGPRGIGAVMRTRAGAAVDERGRGEVVAATKEDGGPALSGGRRVRRPGAAKGDWRMRRRRSCCGRGKTPTST